MDRTHDRDSPDFEELAEAERLESAPAAGAPEPGFGAFTPGPFARLGLAIGRALPAGAAGLKLAGAARPLALSGVRNGIADVEALGLRLRLHPKDNLSEKRLFMTPQCFDPVELAALADVMGPGRTFLDIGANAGGYALFAAKAGGSASRVIAVEPQREMRRRLAYNARLNGLDNLEITGVALSDYEGESVLRLVESNLGRTALAGDAGGGEAVRVTMLETLLNELGVGRVDAMKIDVEGGEARILAPFFAKADPARRPDLIVMERPAVNREDGGADPVALACANGYRLRQETRMNAILERVASRPR